MEKRSQCNDGKETQPTEGETKQRIMGQREVCKYFNQQAVKLSWYQSHPGIIWDLSLDT
jgi:hypothetical protein